MRENNFKTGIIHGETAQEERSRITTKFRMGDLTTLIATDIFSRGLDYPDVNIYMHRCQQLLIMIYRALESCTCIE